MIALKVLLTEHELADEFVAAFRTRRFAEKFFYWFPLSVRAWLALCSDGAYRNYVRSRSLIAQSSDDLARYIPPGPLEVLSLGSGQGDKDLLLFEALSRRGVRVSYTPVDTSQALLELACEGAQGAGVPVRGLKADFTRSDHRAALVPDRDAPPRLVLLLGNTLGAFDPLSEARALRGLLRAQDLLLVDGEIYAAHTTVQGYDNPLNRRFAWAPLNAIGITDADGELIFEDREDRRRPGLHPLAKHFRAGRDVAASLGGESLTLAAAERLELNHSYKYDASAFLEMLREAGLADRWHGTSGDGRFQMVLAGAA